MILKMTMMLVGNVTNEGGAEVNTSSALKQIIEFESSIKSSRNKTQETVKQLIYNVEFADDTGSLSVQNTNEITEKMDNLIQQIDWWIGF